MTTERPGQSSKTRQSTLATTVAARKEVYCKQKLFRATVIKVKNYRLPTTTTVLATPPIPNQGWDGQQTSTRASVRNTYDSSGRYIVDSYQQYPGLGEKRISSVVSRNATAAPTVVSDSLGNRAYSYYSPADANTLPIAMPVAGKKLGSVATPVNVPVAQPMWRAHRMPMAVPVNSVMTS